MKEYITINKKNLYEILKKKKVDVTIYIVTLLLLFLLFQQGDLFHTVISTQAYLKGHIIDFYEYNKSIVVRNDYLPTIYIIFAIWNLPMKLFGLTEGYGISKFRGYLLTYRDLYWNKLLLVVFFILTLIIIHKIVSLLTQADKKKSLFAILVFATSPIVVFDIFIFGQYDIIQLFFCLLALLYYFQKEFYKFSIIISVAISIKFFPIMLFIPLILIVEKRIFKILQYAIIAMSVTFLEMLIYRNNLKDFLLILKGKNSELFFISISNLNIQILLFSMFVLLCLYCYIKDFANDEDWAKKSIVVCQIAYGSLFFCVVWHPQWLILLMAFFSIGSIYIKDLKKFIVIDNIGSILYLFIVPYIWGNNLYTYMLYNGILRNILRYDIPLRMHDILSAHTIIIFENVFGIYLFLPLIFYLVEKKSESKELNKIKNLFRIRFSISIFFFVILCFFFAFAPKDIAQKFNPTAYTKQGLIIENSAAAIPIIEDKTFEQSFVSEDDKLSMIGLKLGTYQRDNNKEIEFILKDKNGNIIRRDISGDDIKDNDWYYFSFEPIKDSKHQKYVIELTSSATLEEGNCNAVWATMEDEYPQGQYCEDGKAQDFDINMQLRYEN